MKLSKQTWSVGLLVLVLLGLCLPTQGYEYKKSSFSKEMAVAYKQAEQQFKKGQAQFKKKQYERAQLHMEKALEIFPLHANAIYHLALMSYMKKDNIGALRNIVAAKQAVVRLNDLKAKVIHERKNKLNEYQKDLKNGFYAGHFGDNNPCLVQFGQFYSDMLATEVELIKDKATDKVMLGIPADFFYVHGNILYRMKSYKKALLQYVEAVKRNPRHGGALNNLATLFLKAQDKEKALVCVRYAEKAGFKVDPRLKKELQ